MKTKKKQHRKRLIKAARLVLKWLEVTGQAKEDGRPAAIILTRALANLDE